MSSSGLRRRPIGYCCFYLAALQLFTYAQGTGSNEQPVEAEPGIQLVLEPSDALASWGATLELPCQARAPRRTPRLAWRHRRDRPPAKDDVLPPHDAHRTQAANGSLVIARLSAAVAGWYQCVAVADGLGAVVSRPALVMLAEVPPLVPGPRSVLGDAGAPLVLPCAVAAPVRLAVRVLSDAAHAAERRVYGAARHHAATPTLALNVTWLREGVVLRGEEARVALSASGALELEPAQARDAGRYRCNVSLAPALLTPDTPKEVAYRLSEEIEVAVSAEAGAAEAAPRFIAKPRPATVIEGSSVTFECAAVGNPRPDMIWLNNGVAIDLSDLDSRFYLVGAGSLRVQWARALDAGAYTCRAHNRIDSEDVGTHLTVLTPPRVSIVGGAVVVARARGDVTLRCEARGRPAPVVSWLKDGEPLTPNSQDIAFVDGDDLRIQGVLDVDSGMFQCYASSVAGHALAALRLHVLPPDDDLSNLTGSYRPPGQTKAKRPPKKYPPNRTLSQSLLNSLVSSDDVNERHRSPTGQEEEPDFLGETSSAFTFGPAHHSDPDAYYDTSVHAASGLDLDTLEGWERAESEAGTPPVPVEGAPAAPRGLQAVLSSQRFVTLSWQDPADGSAAVTGYVVLYRADGSQRERTARGGGQRREMNVAALQPNTTYQFRVFAVGAAPHQLSPPSETVEATTAAEEWAFGPPRDVRAEPAAPTALRVSWLPPPPAPPLASDATPTDATPPDKYRVHVTEVESGREQWQWSPAGATALTMGGLRAGAEYAVRVAAAGGASSAELRVRTPPAAPAAPPGNVTATPTSATSILVRWEAPPARTHRGALTGYKIRYRAAPAQNAGTGAAASRRKAESLTTPADARRAELRGLDRATTYQVRVCALNANGSGPFSEWASASTQPHDLDESAVPPQPPPLRTRSGRDWISVWWTPEASGGTEAETGSGGVRVRTYSLGWGLGVPDEHARDLPAHTHSHVIRELQSNAEYVISLRATNALGPGPPVYATVRTRNAPDHLDELDELPEDEEPDEDDDDEDEDEERAPALIPPVGLKVIMLSGTTSVVYWTDPTLPRGQTATDGRRYVVRWSAAGAGAGGGGGGAGGGRARTFNATDLNCMIDELKPFTTYEFAVKLIKGGRESAWSMLVSNTTLEATPASAPRELRVTPAAHPASPSRAADLTWTPPARPNGLITGYVIMYAAESRAAAATAGDWVAVGVAGARGGARVERLRPRTTYLFKVQARNAKGLGPFTAAVRHTTAMEEGGGALSGATSAWLWASAGGACAVLALAAALALSLCCRRGAPPLSPDRSTYQKSAATAAIKPPDLWIHHDQMELKHMDKGLHGSAMSAGSVEGAAMMSSTLTLGRAPPAEYEPARHPALPPLAAHAPHPGSVDRRHYVPTYVERACASLGSDDTAMLRASPASLSCAGACCHRCEPCARCDYNPMSSVGCASTCERRPHRPAIALPDQSTPLLSGASLGSPQSSLGSLAPLHPPPAPCGSGACPLGSACAAGAPPGAAGAPLAAPGAPLAAPGGSLSGGSDVYACAARERGHYVAYEPLGHYTHRDSLSSEAGAAAANVGGGGSLSGGSLQRRIGVPPTTNPLHSFTLPAEHSSNQSTPSHGKNSTRDTSPYKKSANSSPGHLANRLQLGAAVAHCSDELEPLTPSRSTERLHREMANLEGLMKDLSAITGHHQFHC